MTNFLSNPSKIIRVDTRQKAGKHDAKHMQLMMLGYEIAPEALKCGDYMLPDGNISVDTKQDLQEVANNLGAEHARFWREIRGAAERKIKLVVLIEQRGYHSLQDVRDWKPRYGVMTGQELFKRMDTARLAWGVQWEFCDKRSTGRRIVEILEGNINVCQH